MKTNAEYSRISRSKLTGEEKKYLNQYYCRSWKAWIGRHIHTAAYEDRIKGRGFNLTSDYIFQLLQSINCRCVISGLQLTHDKSLNSLSIDRIDNNIGHIIGNVQLVCLGINLAKNNSSNDDIKFAIDCINGKKSFIPNKLSRDYLSTCRRNAIQRDNGNNLTTDLLVDLYNQQNGKCWFTGIDMAGYKHPCLSVSIDRMDCKKPHDIDNIRLTIKCINRAKRHYGDLIIESWIKQLRDL